MVAPSCRFFALTRALSTRCEVHLAVSEGALHHPVLRAACEALDHTVVTIHPSTAPLNAGTIYAQPAPAPPSLGRE